MHIGSLVFAEVSLLAVACAGADESTGEPHRGETAIEATLPASSPPADPPPIPPGEAHVDGSIDGRAFEAASVQMFAGRLTDRTARTGIRIVVSTQPEICGHADLVGPGQRELRLDVEAAGVDPGVGTYAIGASRPGATGRFESRSNACLAKLFVATEGVVAVESVDRVHVRGTFDVKIGVDRLTGRFDAPRCAELLAPPLTTRCE